MTARVEQWVVECARGKRRPNCDFVPRNAASQCPPTRSSHAIRSGSITWQRNPGSDPEAVAKRVAATPDVIRHHYDGPDYDDVLEWRRAETPSIDIETHLHPTDPLSEDGR